MPLNKGAIPVLEIGTTVEALHQHMGGTHDYALQCLRTAPSIGVVACTHHRWSKLFASIGDIVSCLFLVGSCSSFYILD